MTLTHQAAVDEAARKARLSATPRAMRYLNAKTEVDALDALSRTRALDECESIRLERAIKRMQEWEAAGL